MTEDEFFHAADETTLTCSDRLVRHLYRETAASFQQRYNYSGCDAVAVPVDQLARILAAVSLVFGVYALGKHRIEF